MSGSEYMNIDLQPNLVKATIIQVNETAVKVSVQGRLGVITVPLRMVFTEKPLAPGQTVTFYFSYMNVL